MATSLSSLDIVAIWIQLPTERARGQFLELLRLLVALHGTDSKKTRQPISEQRLQETLQKNLDPQGIMSPYQ